MVTDWTASLRGWDTQGIAGFEVCCSTLAIRHPEVSLKQTTDTSSLYPRPRERGGLLDACRLNDRGKQYWPLG